MAGQIEIRGMLVLYAVSLLLQALTTASILEQGSWPLLVLTAIQAGVVVSFFWLLLANALLATQVRGRIIPEITKLT
jgi:Chitin synthase export chaperone